MENSKYRVYYEKNCFSISFRTFPEIRDQIYKYMEDPKCPPDVKLLFGDWLFRKLYMLYKPSSDIKKKKCENIQNAVVKSKNIIHRSNYLKYHDVLAMSIIAEYFYVNRFEDVDQDFILQMLNDTQLIKNYLQSPKYEEDQIKRHFIEWIRKVKIYEQKSNLLDVLLKNFGNDVEVKKIYAEMSGSEGIYSNKQNVHDESIQQSVTKAADLLVNWLENAKDQYLIPSGISRNAWVSEKIKEWYKNSPDYKFAKAVVKRSYIDTTIFVGENSSFTISDTLVALVHYIHYSENFDELKKILLEEMKDMAELCSSGYVARFLNVLQGFDDTYRVTITSEKQLYAVISHKLAQSMEKANEDVIAGSVDDEHKEAYAKFIENIIQQEINLLFQDYGKEDVLIFLPNVVTKMTGLKCEFVNLEFHVAIQ